MEKIIENNQCSGCHACFNICPKGAIEMIEDKRGFLQPIINNDKCVDCGLCKKTCPILNKRIEAKKKIQSYACYNKNNGERKNSSSGGIFVLLAREILNRNGVIFGAKFNKNFEVVHFYCEDEKDLFDYMGSKYSQSIIGNSFKKVKEFLDSDRYVLFTGTPCQIEGLKSYLKKDYKKLYTQDIICHGVPSPKLFKKYLDFLEKKYKEEIRNYQFRNKDHGWSLFQTKILFETRTYSKMHKDDLFMRAFLSNICLRESCYNCSFKKKYRESDITLGDYWGVNNIHPKMNDDNGVSLLIVNSKKGEELFESIINDIVYVKTDLEKAIKYNSAMIKSVPHNKYEDEFLKNMDNLEIDLLINKYVPRASITKRICRNAKNIIKKILKK